MHLIETFSQINYERIQVFLCVFAYLSLNLDQEQSKNVIDGRCDYLVLMWLVLLSSFFPVLFDIFKIVLAGILAHLYYFLIIILTMREGESLVKIHSEGLHISLIISLHLLLFLLFLTLALTLIPRVGMMPAIF